MEKTLLDKYLKSCTKQEFKAPVWATSNEEFSPNCLICRNDSNGSTMVYVTKVSDSVVNYFYTDLYIDIESLNIILFGNRGGYDVVVASIPMLLEIHKIPLNRNDILLALENSVHKKQEEWFTQRTGSIISASVMETDTDFSKVVYWHLVLTVVDKVKRSLPRFSVSLDKSRRVAAMFPCLETYYRILRSVGMDYAMNASLGNPKLVQKLTEKVGIPLRDSDIEVMCDTEKLSDIVTIDWKNELQENIIDIGRLSDRIKKVRGVS